MQDAKVRARRIHAKVLRCGPQQVRFHINRVLTYPYPAPRGYGTRGLMIAVYSIDTPVEWIEEDLRALLSELG